MASKLDQTLAGALRTHADELKAVYGARDTQAKAYEDMYLMDWSDKPNDDGVKVTISPDARNKVLGAKRLLNATAPEFKVPHDMGDEIENSSDIEQACKKIWFQAGRISGMPIHYSLVESALLFGAVHVAITSTKDLLERAKELKQGVARAERVAAVTPFLYEVWNPRYGYPEMDVMGLSAYYREVQVKVNTVKTRFGEDAAAVIGGRKDTELVKLGIFYDSDNYAVWVDGTPIIATEHGLPYIPVRVAICEGSMLFDKPEHQVQPHLYTLHKSGLWERQNLVLTVLYTNLFNIGINPTFKFTSPNGNDLDYDFNKPGGVIKLQQGETFEPMATKGIIDPSFTAAMEIAENKVSESTMFSQALGQPITGNAAFSTVNLLSQSGRLPLTMVREMAAMAMSDIMETSLLWYKKIGGKIKNFNLKSSDIPENIQIETNLEVSLPQDKLQLANIAKILTDGNQPITSLEWARENILAIGQSDKMDKDVWSEKVFAALASNYAQMQTQIMIQSMQPQQPTAPGMPQPGQQPPEAMPAQPGQQLPPELMGAGAMPGGGVEGQGFNPAMGGLPPQMGGMVPGQGQATLPEEGLM